MKKVLVVFCLFFCIATVVNAQRGAMYLFEKDFYDAMEVFKDIDFINHKGRFEIDTVDVSNKVERYVYHFDSNSGLRFRDDTYPDFLSKSFTIEMVFKSVQMDANTSVFKLKDSKGNSVTFPYINPISKSSDYIHYLVTRNLNANTLELFINGDLVKVYTDKERLAINPKEVIFFGQNGAVCEGSLAMIQMVDQYYSHDEVATSIEFLKDVIISSEVYVPDNNESLTVFFQNAETGEPIKGHLKVLNGKSELFNSATSEIGYQINYVKKITYKLIVKPDDKGFMTTVKDVVITETPAQQTILIYPITVGGTFQLQSIQFKKSETIMVEGAKDDLDHLVGLMMDNPKMEILIGGHTDGIGNDELNKELSRLRAMVVEEYLVEQGISRDRLTVEGYGGTKPLVQNTVERDRQLNRRVEFTILKM